MSWRIWTTLPMTMVVLTLSTNDAAAQTDSQVTIDFEVGDFDPEFGDWPITAVNVSGALTSGSPFTVELRDGDGEVVWSGTDEYTPPQTTIEVEPFVAVGEVEEAGIAQRQPEVVDPADPEDPAAVLDDAVVRDRAQRVDPPEPVDPAEPADPPEPPEVEADVTNSEGGGPLWQGNGFGGAGQLALTMVVAVIFVAILFRSPLPSATTTRWRK